MVTLATKEVQQGRSVRLERQDAAEEGLWPIDLDSCQPRTYKIRSRRTESSILLMDFSTLPRAWRHTPSQELEPIEYRTCNGGQGPKAYTGSVIIDPEAVLSWAELHGPLKSLY